ncbi:MAG: hypothetical protein EXS63_02860 [Candidatus Omnitrophica bacterium]|nr:hypothetical protein [Candidatus Omnitrophota bacterium]
MAAEFYCFVIGAFTGFVGCLVSWQLNLVVMHRGLERGRHDAFFVGLGAVSADIVFLGGAFTGLYSLTGHPEWWIHLKWVSILMLLSVAARTYFRKKTIISANPVKKKNPARNFLLGFILVISNPLLFILWVGILSFLVAHFPDAQILDHQWIFLTSFYAGSSAWFAILAGVILHHARKWDDEKLHALSRIFSVGLVIGALILIWAKF